MSSKIETPPIITRQWQMGASTGNFLVGFFELLTGNLSTMSVAIDGVHCFIDGGTYYVQSESLLNKKLTDRSREQIDKLVHWTIFLSSLGFSAKAGYDLFQDIEPQQHTGTYFAAGASLILNGLMLARLRKGKKHKKKKLAQQGVTYKPSPGENNLEKHFWKVDMPSAAVAGLGAALYKVHPNIEQALAISSGMYAAWAFRPTVKNYGHHDCLSHANLEAETSHHGYTHHHHETKPHGHGHGHTIYTGLPDPHIHTQDKTPRKKHSWGIAAAVLSMAGGILAGDSSLSVPPSQETLNNPAASHNTFERTTPRPSITASSITEQVAVAPGDSFWRLIDQQLHNAGIPDAPNSVTNVSTIFTAYKNSQTISNPDSINPGQFVTIPTENVARILHGTLTGTVPSNPEFTADLLSLNQQPTMADALNKTQELDRIDSFLRQKLQPSHHFAALPQ